MTLLWKCDGCGKVRAARKCPKGWGITSVQRDPKHWEFKHQCVDCKGKSLPDAQTRPTRKKEPAKRRQAQRQPREPKPPPKDQGSLF